MAKPYSYKEDIVMKKPSRQMIAGYISMLAGLFTFMGVDLDPETKAALLNNIESIIGAGVALYGVVLVLFRKITSSPMVGWISKQE